MEKKKNKRKWREIRSAITMMCVMAAMLSTATFAWFTLTDSPTVTGLEMKAVSTGGLMVAKKNEESAFTNAIQIDEADNQTDNLNGTLEPLELRPVTVSTKDDVTGFSLPQYSGGEVTGLQTPKSSAADLKGLVAVYTYYIKSQEGEVNVGIIAGDPSQTTKVELANSAPSSAGTFARSKTDDDGKSTTDQAEGDATYALRMGIVATDAGGTPSIANMKIIEPNSDKNNANGNKATDSRSDTSVKMSHVKLTSAGQIASDSTSGYIGANSTEDPTVSGSLFTVGTTAKKVTMYIWIEGADVDCVDEIKTDEIVAQIQFTSLGAVTGTGTGA